MHFGVAQQAFYGTDVARDKIFVCANVAYETN